MGRAHNDANILCLGARVLGSGAAVDILRAWLETDFEGGRHHRRVEMLAGIKTCVEPRPEEQT
jgi:ribose 5-phosphate isomerase B